MENLLDCPFCGNIPKVEKCCEYWTVTCKDSDCFGYRYFDGEYGCTEPSFKTEEEAIKVWNTRKGVNNAE